MSELDKLRKLKEHIINSFGENRYNVAILIDTDGYYLRVIYNGNTVCKIKDQMEYNQTYHIVFEDDFSEYHLPRLERCCSIGSIAYCIEQRIMYYNKKKGQKNRIDICENNNRIDINVDASNLADDIAKSIYMMTARGNGKTRFVSDLLKNKTVVYNGNIYTNIENVIFNDPATIVFWTDGSKTVVKCQPGEAFDPEKGLAMAISKKVLGNDYGYYETFAKYVGRYNKKRFNKALEEAKKITPDEISYNGKTYVLKNKEK